jgi:hypothetical protein
MDDLIINELISLPYIERYKIYNCTYTELLHLLDEYESRQLYGICFFIKSLIDTSNTLQLKLYRYNRTF